MKCCDVRTNSLKQYHKECTKNMRGNKTYFHKKGFALVLVLKVRVLEVGSGIFLFLAS